MTEVATAPRQGDMQEPARINHWIDGKRVVTRRIAKVENAVGCRILFVSGLGDDELIRVLQMVEKTGVLTVSDMPQFVDRGGMIQFVSQDNKVRFAVNVAAGQTYVIPASSGSVRTANGGYVAAAAGTF